MTDPAIIAAMALGTPLLLWVLGKLRRLFRSRRPPPPVVFIFIPPRTWETPMPATRPEIERRN